MRIAIITAAGISSRFNEGLKESDKELKAIYHERGSRETLLLRLVQHCAYADEIIIVGGYLFDRLKDYIDTALAEAVQSKLTLVYNPHYEDLASGYSLYLGLKEAIRRDGLSEILFAEGDLDVDDGSFQRVVGQAGDVLTCNRRPIYSDQAVVLYQTGDGRYHYAFNASHGLLSIDESFSCILNSGQIWKFADTERLQNACEKFGKTDRTGTNLRIIQEYLDGGDPQNVTVVFLDEWTNCNTRQDFQRIFKRWEAEM